MRMHLATDLPTASVRRDKMRISSDAIGGDRDIDVRSSNAGAIVDTVPKAAGAEVRHAAAMLRATH